MSKGARLAMVAGIIVAIAIGATVVAVSMAQEPSIKPGNDNNMISKPKQIDVNLNENLTVKAK